MLISRLKLSIIFSLNDLCEIFATQRTFKSIITLFFEHKLGKPRAVKVSTMKKIVLFLLFTTSIFSNPLQSQHSVAREWNEVLLEAIRSDLARPTVHARNLFHVSAAMYDAWAVFDDAAETYLLGQTLNGFECPFDGFATPADIEAAREEAVSFAAYRLLRNRFASSPGRVVSYQRFDALMSQLGYDSGFLSPDYQSTGLASALGNYIAQCYINYGYADGSNQLRNYQNEYYQPINPPLVTQDPGNPNIIDPNRWQPLTLDVFIDQSGNVIPFNTPPFLSPEWGNVYPFSMTDSDKTVFQRDGDTYQVYHDPGAPPYIDPVNGGPMSDEWKWGFQLVAVWGSHLDSDFTDTYDISPGNQGNFNPDNFPDAFADYPSFYNLMEGGDPSTGRSINPSTGMPYAPNVVKRGDYGRVLAEFWADGPDSETPPGHWYTILNYVNEQPQLEKRFGGEGPLMNDLEWDIKTYFTLGGTMHDCAVSAWGIKGYYDYIRPVSAIRYMASKGQASDPSLPNYDPAGFILMPDFIEIVEAGDPLAGNAGQHVGKVKLYSWRGPDYISNPAFSDAGVGWILAENWWPYQRPSFVTPNFAGYVSGHSTYSRGAAEVLTMLTGDEYFPGGMGVFEAPQNNFLVFEQGPSETIQLQWATYRDASDQCSLSRIWGGIHPPADDIPGRRIGLEIGNSAFAKARDLFYKDDDNDGYLNYLDCDDNDPNSFPGAAETCDGKDNNCDGFIDEALPIFTYYLDLDGDGFGDGGAPLDTCLQSAPFGFSTNDLDCRDDDSTINPDRNELCDEIDNDCNGFVDDGIPMFTYFRDSDGDGYGNGSIVKDTCWFDPPIGFCDNNLDCNDDDFEINPDVFEICDGVDNDCNGDIDDFLPLNAYFFDNDGDGFGDPAIRMDTCQNFAPNGFVTNAMDCNDDNPLINPNSPEICDEIDNNCNGRVDDNIPYFTYFEDSDGDGFGNAESSIYICYDMPPVGYVTDNTDCDDLANDKYPNNAEVADNGIDEDCSGVDLYLQTKFFPNPVSDLLTVRYVHDGALNYQIIDMAGRTIAEDFLTFEFNEAQVMLPSLPAGVYLFVLSNNGGERLHVEKIATY